MTGPDQSLPEPPRDDPTEWQIHTALAALDRVALQDAPWLRALDEYYWLRLEGNRAGYLRLAHILLRAASTRGVNREYVSTDEANRELGAVLVASSQLHLALSPHRDTPPPTGAVGARRWRAQLQHAAALWGCGIAAFVAAMVLLFVVAAALGWLQD